MDKWEKSHGQFLYSWYPQDLMVQAPSLEETAGCYYRLESIPSPLMCAPS